MRDPVYSPGHPRGRARQSGIVMIVTLIVLALLMVGGLALMRSSDSSSALAGQLAFRRDMKNQGERGMEVALGLLNTGALQSPAARQANVATANYSAIKLSSNSQGLPDVLMQSDAALAAAGMTGAAITDSAAGVSVRTIIDRLCSASGAATDANCVRLPMECSAKGGQDQSGMGGQATTCYGTAYRISVRVDGPRSTQAFFQSVVAR